MLILPDHPTPIRKVTQVPEIRCLIFFMTVKKRQD